MFSEKLDKELIFTTRKGRDGLICITNELSLKLNYLCIHNIENKNKIGECGNRREHKISVMSTDSQFEHVVNCTDMTEIYNQGIICHL